MTSKLTFDSIDLEGLSAPPSDNPLAGRYKLYPDDNGNLYTLDSTGSAVKIAPNSTLSDYENVIVVDSGGAGDYTTLSAALAAIPLLTPTFILVMNSTNEPSGTFSLFTNKPAHVYICSGAVVKGNFTIDVNGTNATLTLSGDGTLGDNLENLALSTGSNGKITLKNTNIVGRISINGGGIYAYDSILNSSNSSFPFPGIKIDGGAEFILDNCKVTQTGTVGVGVSFSQTDSSYPAGSYAKKCIFNGDIAGTSTVSTSVLDMTHCEIFNDLGGVILAAGNYSNTVNGVTYPTIINYSSLVFLISQIGTNNPTVTILQNDLDLSVSFVRNAAGVYFATFPADTFPTSKTITLIGQQETNSVSFCYAGSTSILVVETRTLAGSPVDSVLDEVSVEVRIYP